MKCKIKYVEVERDREAVTVVEVKLHRHTINITGLLETDAIELEELLMKATKIKVRRYENDSSKKIQGNEFNNKSN